MRAALVGPLGRGERVEEKSVGRPEWIPAGFPPAQGCAVGKLRNPLAHFPGTTSGKRAPGVPFSLGYFSFGQAKEK
jgi:hypothetical protein